MEKTQESLYVEQLSKKTEYDFSSDKECATFVETVTTLARIAVGTSKGASVKVNTAGDGSLTSLSVNLH